MDGTLIDTEPYWMQAESELVASYGQTWTHEDGLQLVGSGLWHSARILQARGVALSEEEIISTLTDRVLAQLVEFGPPWRPGARELLVELREAGIPTAIVTMSVRRMAEHIVAQLGFEAFDAIVSSDDVEHSKPHPDPYFRGAAALGVDIVDCIAIEDSATGIASAAASGARTVGVPFMVQIPESSDYTLWPTLEGRTLADLTALAARA